eukprot:gb/GECG01001559.1/.p1 GENE.gb/GECG01001559.1/~~gb/GECG01001559.1/.p1  ORF type:complete len:492 (+),score=82.52 gb/GECG01001559.1/:1-1476(+)
MSGAIAPPSGTPVPSNEEDGTVMNEGLSGAGQGAKGGGGARGSKTHKKGQSDGPSQPHFGGTLQQKGDENNLKPGTHVMAQWRDQSWRKAIVIERAPVVDQPHTDDIHHYRYYVHYKGINRRNDEWITSDRIKWDPEQEHEEKEHERKVEEDKAKSENKGDSNVLEAIEPEHNEHEGMDEASIREHEEVTKIKNVNFVELGRYKMEAWYFSPFPKEYWPNGLIDTLHVEEFNLQYFRTKEELRRYEKRQPRKYPPGDEIYRHENIAVFEVNGSAQKEYCQNLCYIAKLFLDHKTLFYDVDPFLFYIFCEVDKYGCHPFGYFSKEKYSESGFNLACILTFPAYQKRGYGRFIIQFSYELSKLEGKVGSPEKPLSDLGLLSYRSYWAWVLLNILAERSIKEKSIMELSRETSIKAEDIEDTLRKEGLLKYVNGQHIICATSELIEEKRQRLNAKKGPVVDPSKIRWAPHPIPIPAKKDKWSLKSKSKKFDPED